MVTITFDIHTHNMIQKKIFFTDEYKHFKNINEYIWDKRVKFFNEMVFVC